MEDLVDKKLSAAVGLVFFTGVSAVVGALVGLLVFLPVGNFELDYRDSFRLDVANTTKSPTAGVLGYRRDCRRVLFLESEREKTVSTLIVADL